jgi:hypothetical protein
MFEDTFGRRRGYIPAPVQGERETLSPAARRKLANIFHRDFCQPNTRRMPGVGEFEFTLPGLQFLREVWTELLGNRLDQFPGWSATLPIIKGLFEQGEWHFPFDIWEGIFKSRPHLVPVLGRTASAIREALERENTAYTFVGGRFVERMTDAEVESIEKMLRSPIEGIRDHFTTALQHLSDRENPDYRNSIKESISAVEAACKHLTGLQNATLGQALNQLHDNRPLHPNLKEALRQLYTWTNDDAGIRHAIKDTSTVESADAQFMLVTCSAFVNYLFER